MKIVLLCLALVGATYAQSHLTREEARSRCLVDKPNVSQGVAYVADLDCAFYWQCDFAYTLLKNVTLKQCAIGSLWASMAYPAPPPAGEEAVVCVSCELQPDQLCRDKYLPLGKTEQCPVYTTPPPTTTEAPPPLGDKKCTLMPQKLAYQEIIGEESKVWYLNANQTVDCGHLIFNFDKCICDGKPEFPGRWNFDVNLNSDNNRIYAANEPVGTVGLSVIEPGCAEFNGSGGLQIPYFKNMRPRSSWVSAVVISRDGSQNAVILYECFSIFINGDEVSASVVVQNPLGEQQTLSVSVTAPPAGYALVILRWDGKVLTLTLIDDGIVYQDSAQVLEDPDNDFIWSIVCLPQQPLFVGYVPSDYNKPGLPGSYSGNICLLYFTDKLYDNDDDVEADIRLDYIGPQW
ncbi:uncharacterized protein LOC106176607 [Lingula anatina]|uniref:Uncharacterized protein LOC106176607 n=1 Tax=Lingula anatina TaxID=7574 RepID=A0A1S3JVU1_LINAN|nr:uncharacterized protein LOC106176607 [Lingula anatina]|eukprot:XP_013414525.1 uncharacterized protein LOC106176607 [Lingula anatina]